MTSAARVLETIDPATGAAIAEVPDASAADFDAAVARAHEAGRPGGEWGSFSPAARARLLWKIADLIDQNADELAELETRDQGQPIGVSRNVSVPAAVPAGNVWVNMPNPLDAAAPWGGVKASGWGREMGKDAIDLYTEVKNVWVSLA